MEKLNKEWSCLHQVLLSADQLSMDELLQRISALDLSPVLIQALKKAVYGETNELLQLLVKSSAMDRELVVMLAPVDVAGRKRYAWMIGKIQASLSDFRNRFKRAGTGVAVDALLTCSIEPPPVIFVSVFAASYFERMPGSTDIDGVVEDFVIFRISEAGNDVQEDIERQLIQNISFISRNMQVALSNGEIVFGESISSLKSVFAGKTEFFGMLHVEAHNRGHFAGPWPFNSAKSGPMHDPIEEFRACLCAVRWSEYLGLSEIEQDAFAVGIFFSRFLYYGLRAYRRPVKTRQSIREITVGLMFFELLRRSGAIQSCHSSGLYLDIALVRPTLLAALKRLHDQESTAWHIGPESLRIVAREWYQVAYPDSEISLAARHIYDVLLKGGD